MFLHSYSNLMGNFVISLQLYLTTNVAAVEKENKQTNNIIN